MGELCWMSKVPQEKWPWSMFFFFFVSLLCHIQFLWFIYSIQNSEVVTITFARYHLHYTIHKLPQLQKRLTVIKKFALPHSVALMMSVGSECTVHIKLHMEMGVPPWDILLETPYNLTELLETFKPHSWMAVLHSGKSAAFLHLHEPYLWMIW